MLFKQKLDDIHAVKKSGSIPEFIWIVYKFNPFSNSGQMAGVVKIHMTCAIETTIYKQ